MSEAPRRDTDSRVNGVREGRPRPVRRLGLATVAVLLLVGVSACDVAEGDARGAETGVDIADEVTPSSETTALPTETREEVGVDSESGLPISVVLPGDADLFGGGTGVTPEDDETLQVGLVVFQATRLAGGSSACSDESWSARSRKPAETAHALGRQLERLPRSTVTRPFDPTSAFGRDAFHVRLQIDNGCPADQAYRVAAAETDFGISYGDTPQVVVVDFLVVDVDGTPIVVALWNEAGAPADLVQQATLVRDSITFVTG
jgi:hypothetical protein